MDAITVPAIGRDGRVEQQTVPFVIGVLADISGERDRARSPLKERRFVIADDATFDYGDGSIASEAPATGSNPEMALIGIRYLTATLGPLSNVRIWIADLAKSELRRDFMRARGSDSSWLHRRLVDDVYSSPGDEPFSVLIVDYEFSNDSRDLELLEDLATVAASTFVPVLAAAGPSMFGLSRFEELPAIRGPESIYDGADHARWRSFRDSEDARFTVLAMPPAIVSRPRAPDKPPATGADFVYQALDRVPGKMNAAYLLGGRLAELFSIGNWWTALNVSEGKFHFGSPMSQGASFGPGTVAISEDLEVELARAGFAVLTGDAAEFAFHAPTTVRRPHQYERPEPTRAAETVVRLINVMAISRLMHHIRKAAVHFSQFAPSPADLEQMLGDWIGRYVRVTDPATGEPVDRSRPLAEAGISLPDADGSAGPCVVRVWVRFGLPDDAPFGTVNNRVVFTLPHVRWSPLPDRDAKDRG